jgi:hypothetical protein
MEPVSLVVTALAAGAATGLKPAAETAIKDAYAGLKALIQRKFGERVDVTPIERSPQSPAKREAVAEDLNAVCADSDAELLVAARSLLELVRTLAPGAAEAIGVDLAAFRAGSLDVEDVEATGIGVRVRGAEIAGDARFHRVRAGGGGAPNP